MASALPKLTMLDDLTRPPITDSRLIAASGNPHSVLMLHVLLGDGHVLAEDGTGNDR